LRSQETKEKVTVNDVDHNYLVRLPKGYVHEQKYPVVILLHGMNQDTEPQIDQASSYLLEITKFTTLG